VGLRPRNLSDEQEHDPGRQYDRTDPVQPAEMTFGPGDPAGPPARRPQPELFPHRDPPLRRERNAPWPVNLAGGRSAAEDRRSQFWAATIPCGSRMNFLATPLSKSA
jgi:hypothetical protein